MAALQTHKAAGHRLSTFFHFSVEARIEQIFSSVNALQKQIRSQFKVALLQQPRNARDLKVEDHYYYMNESAADIVALTSMNLTAELAKVAASVTFNVSKDVKTTVKASAGGKKRVSKATNKKKSSILAAAPTNSTAVRRSTRKRFAPSFLLSETPLASSTLTAAALGGFNTAKSSRVKGRMTAQTPASGMSFFGAGGMPGMITPKFDPATPMNRTAMRGKRDDEKWLVSMNGSPVYIGGKKGKGNDNNVIPLPLGNGQTLVVPADNPEVQPMIQNLIASCMAIMNRK
jgi:hypothetical protein